MKEKKERKPKQTKNQSQEKKENVITKLKQKTNERKKKRHVER